MQQIQTVGIVLFDGVERLDYEGPAGVFGWSACATGMSLSVQRVFN